MLQEASPGGRPTSASAVDGVALRANGVADAADIYAAAAQRAGHSPQNNGALRYVPFGTPLPRCYRVFFLVFARVCGIVIIFFLVVFRACDTPPSKSCRVSFTAAVMVSALLLTGRFFNISIYLFSSSSSRARTAECADCGHSSFVRMTQMK